MRNETPTDKLRKKVEELDKMPTIPAVLAPLLRYLEQPLDQLNLQEVVNLISKDESLAAQCLHMANSPLFGRYQDIDNIRTAVMALGIHRMRDIAVSCSLLMLLPKNQSGVDPIVFWEHSLGCALVCRQFAQKIGYSNPAKAYLAGLLHDIGIVVHLWILPKEFAQALALAASQGIPLEEAEQLTMGMTHADSGRIVATKWRLTPDLIEVVSHHHDVRQAESDGDLLALVSLSDLLCRMNGLGYGYIEQRQVDFLEQPGFALLLQQCPKLKMFDWARFTFELKTYIEEVHRLVRLFYRASA